MTREEASKLYRELMQDLRESASTGLDMSPGDPLAGRALKALEAVIESLPNAPADLPAVAGKVRRDVGSLEPESTATHNMRTDPAYAPYCMRYPGLRRMRRVSAVLAECAVCGAVHDISGPNAGALPRNEVE